MKGIFVIFLALHVVCVKCRAGLQKWMLGIHFSNFLDDHPAQLHVSIVLHLMDCHVHFRFYRQGCILEWMIRIWAPVAKNTKQFMTRTSTPA